MPAFSETLGSTQVWQISQMLKNADKLPEQTTAALTKSAPVPTPAASPSPTPATPPKK
jgi:hypothetical protein